MRTRPPSVGPDPLAVNAGQPDAAKSGDLSKPEVDDERLPRRRKKGKKPRRKPLREGANVTPPRVCPLEAAKRVYRKWLRLPDDRVLDFVFGVVLANRLQGGDPVWGGLVGASGDTKTEILRSLESPDDRQNRDDPDRIIYSLSGLTSKTLISGLPATMNDDREPSLLLQLKGKILVIKDLTPLITGPRDTRSEVLGQLRDAYDGYSAKSFGTGETKSFDSRFGMLFGVTPFIETCWPIINQLGERFLYYRCSDVDSLDKVRAALANSDKKHGMRAELAEAARPVLYQPIPDAVHVEDDLVERIAQLADFAAKARTPVKREGRSEIIEYAPVPEVGTRLAGQLIQLARGIAIAKD